MPALVKAAAQQKMTENAKQIWDFVKNGPTKTMLDPTAPKYPLKKEAEYGIYNNNQVLITHMITYKYFNTHEEVAPIR
ncbi:MAG: hypothetical protein RL711_1281, partial [Bacteroidota bacterium]